MRFPLSLLLGIAIENIFSNVVKRINPLTFSRNYFWPLSVFFTEVLLANYVVINFLNRFSPCNDMKSLSINELFIILWVTLLFTSKALYSSGYRYTGLYPLSFLFILTTGAAILRLLGSALRPKARKGHDREFMDRHSGYSSHPQIGIEEENHENTQQFQNQSESLQDEQTSTQEDNGSPPFLEDHFTLTMIKTPIQNYHNMTKGHLY